MTTGPLATHAPLPWVAAALAGLVLLAGCGDEVQPAAGSGTGTAATVTSTPSASPLATGSAGPTPTAEPTTAPATPDASSTGSGGGIGELLGITPLRLGTDESMETPVEPAVEVSGPAELAEAYADLPGVDAAVERLEAYPPTAEERVFVYVASACRMDDLSLELRGDRLTMVIHGNRTLRCVPPPLTMVIWKVAAADLPAEVRPARAVQR